MSDLWKKLFSAPNEKTDIELHVAGATIRHKNPFEQLEVPRNIEQLSKDFLEKWVFPFYMSDFSNLNSRQTNDLIEVYSEITNDVIEKLLGDFNWRTRIVGAYFSALKKSIDFEETIGNHFLKSEVCFAGRGYCFALATFETDKSKNFLKKYLDYYLLQKDLWFEQGEAMAALDWLDKMDAENYELLWRNFSLDKPNWNLQNIKINFAKGMNKISEIRKSSSKKK